MRFLMGFFALILMLVALGLSTTSAADDRPKTFTGCVLAGGQVRNDGNEISCRLVRSWDFRIYYTVSTDCDEELEAEHWGETHGGVMTYLLEPHRTTELPEDTREMDIAGIGTPIPCLDR